MLVLICISSLLAFYAFRIAPRWLRVSRLRVHVPGLRKEWSGLRVAHLSDFHLGASFMPTDHLWRARSIALDFEPNIIALTGDFYDQGKVGSANGLFHDWPCGAHVFGVMGNHDRRGEPGTLERIKGELLSAGVTILDNEAREVCVRGRKAWIAGVDDAHTFHSDVKRALASIPDGETPLLFLSHCPDAIRQLPTGRVSVFLTGHTHGGQVRLIPSGAVPMVGWLRKIKRATPRPDGPVHRRWHWMKGTVVIVSDGLGVSNLPVRFRTRPHLILLEIQPAKNLDGHPCDDVRRYVEETEPENAILAWLT
jgi:uncharacterized protein